MKTFLWVNLYAILVGIGGYIGGVLTGGVVKIMIKDTWELAKSFAFVRTILAIFRGVK